MRDYSKTPQVIGLPLNINIGSMPILILIKLKIKTMFKIKYYYRTGNSFGSHDEEGLVELDFNDIKVAEANLDRINEHYKQYQELNSYNGWFVKKEKLAAYKENPDKYSVIDESMKERFLKEGYLLKNVIDNYEAENCIILYTDEGKPFRFSADWCGYFESLQSVEIIIKSKKYEY